MALAIAWRNPNPVQTTKRCIRFGEGIPTDIYLVLERIAGTDEQQRANMSVLEVTLQ
jgi:hypothetical protein